MLSIFNNGSYAWVLLLFLIAWVMGWGYRLYKSHKSGYQKQLPNGEWVDAKPSLWSNGSFIMLLLGVIAIIGFMIWINSEYK